MIFSGNINSDDFDLSIKAWRINNPAVEASMNDMKSSKRDQLLRQSDAHQFSQQTDAIQTKEESFSISVYILLILTLAVIILFLNYCRKKRRRKYFLFL